MGVLFTKPGPEVFAGFDAAGNARRVDNHDAQVWAAEIESVVDMAGVIGTVGYTSLATLNAHLDFDSNTLAWVKGDSTASNNGIYIKSGVSGSGSWVKFADLPYSFINLTDAGAGSANAIQLTSSLPTSASTLRIANVFETNTGNVTVSENGAAARALLTASGNQISAGGLVAGMMIIYVDDGTNFRLLTDQSGTAIQAAAEDAADRAEAAAATTNLPPVTAAAVLRGKADASGWETDEGYRPVYMVEDQAGATTNDKLLFALDNAEKNGGIVIGNPLMSAVVPTDIITVPSRVALRGRGLRITPNVARANVVKAEASGVDIEISGLDIDCSGGSSTTAVIEAEGVAGITMRGNRVKKFSGYGLSVLSASDRAATDVVMEGNYLYDPAAGVIFPFIVRSVQGNVHWPKRVSVSFNRYFGSDPANPVAGDYLAGDRITPAGGAHCADCIVLQGCEDFDVFGNNVEYSGSAVVSVTNGSYYGRVAHNSARIAYEGYNIGAGVMMVYCADISDFQVSSSYNCSTANVANCKVLAKSPDSVGNGGWLWLNGITGLNIPAIGETITQATTGASDAIVDVRHGAFNVSVYGNEAIDCGARGPDTGAGVTTYGAYNWIGAQGVNRCTNNVYSNPLGVGQANRHTSNSKSKVLVGANRVGGRAARPWIDSSHTGDYVLSAAGTYGAWLGMDVAGGGVALAGRGACDGAGTLSRALNITSVSRTGTGVYVYTIPDLGLGDYYQVKVDLSGAGFASITYTSATSFTVTTRNTSATAADIAHRVTILA
jgi:hypothetical protein